MLFGNWKTVVAGIGLVAGLCTLSACGSDADVVNENLTKDADNFKIPRRVIFYNGITGDYILTIEGYCSIDPTDANNFRVTCKTNGGYIRDSLGRSDNVTYFVEQMAPASVSKDHYKVVFKPSVLIPSIEVR